MSEPDIACDLCGLKLANARLANEMFLVAPSEKHIGPQRHQRMFEGECPTHGHRFAAFPNRGHSTLLESRIEKHFTKAERKKLRATLSDQERIKFQAALRGQYVWDDEDVARWRGALAT
jgi:hypothetical protein